MLLGRRENRSISSSEGDEGEGGGGQVLYSKKNFNATGVSVGPEGLSKEQPWLNSLQRSVGREAFWTWKHEGKKEIWGEEFQRGRSYSVYAAKGGERHGATGSRSGRANQRTFWSHLWRRYGGKTLPGDGGVPGDYYTGEGLMASRKRQL